jgi:hypothetical protein
MTSEESWRPVIAALANDTARRVFAEAVLGRAADPEGTLSSLSPSRARHVLSQLESAGMLRTTEDGGIRVDDAIYRALLAGSRKPRPVGIDRFLTAEGRIRSYPANETERTALLVAIAERAVAEGEVLTEAELNERLSALTDDVALLRRYLVDYGELERTRSGSEYARPA